MTSYYCLRCDYIGSSESDIESHITQAHGGSGMEMYSTAPPRTPAMSANPLGAAGMGYSMAIGTAYPRTGLSSTNSSYIKDAGESKRGASIYGHVPLVIALFLVSVVLIIWALSSGNNGQQQTSNPWPIVAGDCMLFGIIFILEGWLEFSLSETIKDIPTIKIDAAAAGLNEISASFTPEAGGPLISLMSKQKCIYYSTTLERYVSAGRNSYWAPCGWAGNAVPALLTDGTGYLAIDLADADMDFGATIYYPNNAQNQLVKTWMMEGQSLIALFSEQNVSQASLANLGIAFSWQEGSNFTIFEGEQLRLAETVIPVDAAYFVMGRISDIAGNVNSKPVKIMSIDPSTKILTVRTKPKASIEGRDMLLTFASFGIGIALIVMSLLYFRII